MARDTDGIGHRWHGTPMAQDTEDTGHRGQISAGQISGSNPDEMDGEGAAFGRIAGSFTLRTSHNCRGCISMCRC